MFKNKGLLVGIAVLFSLLIGVGTVLYCLGQTISRLANKVEISIIANEIELNKMNKELQSYFKQVATIDLLQLEADKALAKRIEDLYNEVKDNGKCIDNSDINTILSANLVLKNAIRGGTGSGTHIRIKNQDYVLTCSHLTEKDEDCLWGYDGKDEYYLKPVKIDRTLDLGLYKFTGTCSKVETLEISDIEPQIGSELVIVGNPAGQPDVVTDGIVAYKTKIHYGVTNTVWFGNSGGALLYKNKLIGILVQLDARIKPPLFVCYGKAVKLNHIKEFLREYTE